MRPKLILGGLVASCAADGGAASPSRRTPAPARRSQTGPATIAPHWTKNTSFPTSIPEGAAYYVVVRGDTLWDISARYLKSPYLWPQIWDQNKYVKDAHWIYPGDPLVLPKLAVVAEQAGPGARRSGPKASAPRARGFPAWSRPARARPARRGPRPGDRGAVAAVRRLRRQRPGGREPVPGRLRGGQRQGRASATATSSTSTRAATRREGGRPLHAAPRRLPGEAPRHREEARHQDRDHGLGQGDPRPGEHGLRRHRAVLPGRPRRRLPEAVREGQRADGGAAGARADCCSTAPTARPPATSSTSRTTSTIAGTGQFVTIDAGTEDGVAPGNVFSVYRIMYPSVPTPRNVVGEATVVAVRERTATAKVTYARKEVMVGDEVELR